MARILVAEDNPGLSKVICFNLERAGHEVFAARNGLLAWQEATQNQYDMVVTDHQMPEMEGVELITRLRETTEYEHVPIFMLTAKQMELGVTKLCDELQISAVLSKPFSPREVVAKVEEFLQPSS